MSLSRFTRALRGVSRIGVDTPVWIYHLQDVRPYSDLTTHLFAEAAAGKVDLVLSTISLAELLAGPWRANDAGRAHRIEGALETLPGVTPAPTTRAVAASAARIRGERNLPLPDALIIASTLAQGAQVLLTNDAQWTRAASLGGQVVFLDDYTT